MRSLLTFGFICMLLPKAGAGQLSCYSCNPMNCDKYTKQTCPSGLDHCLTASATVLDKKFTLKTCASKEMCDLSQSLPGVTLDSVKCCKENLCNSAESFTWSFLPLFVPLLFSILF